jgi:hypothetical protein
MTIGRAAVKAEKIAKIRGSAVIYKVNYLYGKPLYHAAEKLPPFGVLVAIYGKQQGSL